MLFTANSANTSHSGQFFCQWSTKNLRYCLSFWFIHSVFPSVWKWNTVDSLILIPNILFSSFVNFAMNWGPLSDTTLSSSLYNFYMLSLNNLTKPSTNIPSVVTTKYVILDNLSQTIRIMSFPATTSNFMMKSTVR